MRLQPHGRRVRSATSIRGRLPVSRAGSKQALFYHALARLIRAAKTDGSAYWGLMGVSFVYGVFHAAGQGHGKAVISSYLLANEETWRRGFALSFASALLQAATAVALVAVAAVLISATAKMMGETVRVIEFVSYALIMLVGRAAPLGKRARLPACPERGRIENRTGDGDGVRSCPPRGRCARPRSSPPRRSRSGRAIASWARSHACARARP